MASMSSVTTRGYGISGGFTGDSSLVITFGYGLGDAIVATDFIDLTLEIDTLLIRDLTLSATTSLLLEVDALDSLDVDVL